MLPKVLDVRFDDLGRVSICRKEGRRVLGVVRVFRILAHRLDEIVVVDVHQH